MWKRFNFFDKALLAGPVLSKDDKELIQEQMRREGGAPMQDRDLSTGEEPEGPYRLLQAFDVICTGFARGRFYAGCHGGVAGIIENSGEPFKRWRAHVLRVTHVMPMAGSDIVATFGDGQDWRDTDVRSARRAMVVAARNHLAEANAWPPHGGPDGTGDTDPEAEGAAAGSVTADMEPMSAAVEAALARTAEVRPRLRIWRTSPAEASSSSSSSAAAAAAVSAGSASSAAAAAAAAGVGASGFAALAASSASSSSWPPVLLRDIPLDVDPDLCPAVTAVAVAEDLHSAAVGLANGAVILIRGDLSRPRGGSVAQVTILPPSAKFEPPAERRGAGHTGRAVTGLFFCRHSETSLDEPVPPGMADAEDSGAAAVAGSGRIQVLYVVTEQSCWSFFTGDSLPQSLRRMPTVTQLLRRRNFDRSPAAAAAVEDDGGDAEEGAAAGCSCVAENGVLVIAGDGGIAPVTPQSRGPFFSLAGQKRGVSWARGRLVVVTSSGERQAVSVLDIRNQLAVLTMPLPLMQAQTAAALMGAGGGAGAGVAAGARHAPRTHAVTDILWGWSGVLLVVTTEGCVHCLWERSTADKLAALRAARRFDVAVRLARSSADFGPAAVAAIVREQGDVAYAEGRFREAAQRFAETIGFVEPSYVVRRFLAAPQTSNLVLYLEALHEKGHASAEHTTLLINCYT
ncbi:vps11, partial [Symbiodinium sp. KB8]